MSIIIKGMTKPKCCGECANWECDLWMNLDERQLHKECHKDCPIIELPPHGRLGDLDALMQKYERLIKQGDISPRSGAYVKVFLADAPTIIEAEENKSLKDRLAECDASDLFPELTEEEKAENKRLAKDFKGAEGSGI